MACTDLIARLEAAPEGSRELDAAITRAICNYKTNDPLWYGPAYTTSLDAAMLLVSKDRHWSEILLAALDHMRQMVGGPLTLERFICFVCAAAMKAQGHE